MDALRFYLFLIYALFADGLNKDHEGNAKDEPEAADVLPNEGPNPKVTNGIFVYRQILRVKRHEQRQAVMKLAQLSDLKKQIKMVEPVVKKILEVLEKSRTTVPRNWDILPYESLAQEDKDGISLVLENVLFFGDIVLRIPDSTHRILKKEKPSRDTIQWAVQFANQTGFLDGADLLTLDLMSQELNFIPRKEGYLNVYTESYKMQVMVLKKQQRRKEKEHQQLQQKQKQEKKKDKIKKPRTLMSGPRAGEL